MELKRLGPYRIGRRLGKGGMGTVYEGRDDEANQSVAIKVLSPALAADEGFRERFTSEIDTLRKLRHPNIVRLYGFGQQDGHLFYSMELVAGVSLEEELTQGRRFEWKEVVLMAIQICKALKHAHDHGVIHRDIKPANVLLAPDGHVKLSDFGIAKLFGNTGMTSTGGVLGTAEYMAPEQADGRPVTNKADLYSLGGLMYALLAGRPPFRSRSLPEMLQLQRFAQPDPVRRYAPQTPEELELIVSELLDKDPDNRIANAMVLSRRLESMYHGLLARERRVSAAEGNQEVDFALGPAEESQRTGSYDKTLAAGPAPTIDPLSATIGATAGAPERAPPGEETGYAVSAGAPAALRTAPAQEATLDAGQVAQAAAAEEPAVARQPRFKTVEEVEREEAEAGPSPLWSIQTALLALALVALVAAGWYLMRPKTAGQLYAEIAAAADSDDPANLAEASSSIDSFLARFPDDPRATEVRQWKQRLELERQQRSLDRLVRRGMAAENLAPVELAYAEALRTADLDPEAGAARLQALVDLFAAQHDLPRQTQTTLELAQAQLERLRARIAENTAAQRKFIDEQFATAESLVGTDPQAAGKIWQAIVTLYGDKPWAAAAVAKAREAIQAFPAPADKP